MATRNISLKLHGLVVSLLVASMSFYASSAPQLPELELLWKNVSVDGKKTAVFCLFKDSRGIMWLGTNSGLYFYDGVTTHSVGVYVVKQKCTTANIVIYSEISLFYYQKFFC